MDNIKSYESIAREAGYKLLDGLCSWRLYYHWVNVRSKETSGMIWWDAQEAWKACCLENGLL